MASRGGVTDDKIKEVRAIMGSALSDMDIIRALYQSKNDVASAVNILFDTKPTWQFKRAVTVKRKPPVPSSTPPATAESNKPAVKVPARPLPPVTGNKSRESVPHGSSQPSSQSPTPPGGVPAVVASAVVLEVPSQANSQPVNNVVDLTLAEDSLFGPDGNYAVGPASDRGPDVSVAAVTTAAATRDPQLTTAPVGDVYAKPAADFIDLTQSEDRKTQDPVVLKPLLPGRTVYKNHPKHVESVTKLKLRLSDSSLFSSPYRDISVKVDIQKLHTKSLVRLQAEWKEDLVLLGQSSVICLSTCKGQKLSPGDDLTFSFPKTVSETPDNRKGWGRNKGAAATSEIVRFSTEKSGEVRILVGG